jgi:tRNA-Thr(GGU) m(6)t(6)A37 methyltransferase TsaA
LPSVQYLFEPIGVVRSPFTERAEAPRQAAAGRDVAGSIELLAGKGFDDALEGLDAWEYAWVLFVFHRNVQEGRGWKPRVQPPRAEAKVGVFATRSPHRPNPIGMSVVKIERIEGLTLHLRDLDLLDGTPVLDLKPYVAYADAYPDSRSAAWLTVPDPRAPWAVTYSDQALQQLAWLSERGLDLRARIDAALALGPQPHAYRRIRKHGAGMRLAVKEWRVDFDVQGRGIVVRGLRSGYRASQLASEPALAVHREFEAALGDVSPPSG